MPNADKELLKMLDGIRLELRTINQSLKTKADMSSLVNGSKCAYCKNRFYIYNKTEIDEPITTLGLACKLDLPIGTGCCSCYEVEENG